VNKLLDLLKNQNHAWADIVEDKDSAIALILNKTSCRFPDYTDHSKIHSDTVMEYCGYLITDLDDLKADELYILLHACLLHDIGMAIPDELLEKYCAQSKIAVPSSPDAKEKTIRENHHIFSALFIESEWKELKIPTEEHAKAIALVAQGHRKIKFEDDNSYSKPFTIGSGNKKIRIAYLSTVLRMADEFDITSARAPQLLRKYFTPDNEISEAEFKKHASVDYVKFEHPVDSMVTITGKAYDINFYNVLKSMFEKISIELKYCQKTLGLFGQPSLKIEHIIEEIEPDGFEPISLKFKIDNERIFTTLMGKNLYKDKFVAIRECIQNCIDACRYKKKQFPNYKPKIIVLLQNNELKISDNGIGMDKHIIENYFATIGKSFYLHDGNAPQGFKSIGQFGIGVASYFLICDEFHVKTCKSDAVLDFKVTSKFDEYFYFNTPSANNHEGTTITYTLTDDVVEEFSHEFIQEQINKTFRFCEIPIILKMNNEDIILSAETLDEKSIKKTLSSSMYPYYRGNLDLLSTHNVYLKNSSIDASCGFVFSSENNPVGFSMISVEPGMRDMSRWFVGGGGGYLINLYNKGVFIKSIKSTSLLNNIVGDINILDGIDLKLDRNDFGLDTQINDLFYELDIKLLEKLKSSIELHPVNDGYFLYNYELTLLLYVNIPRKDGIAQLPKQIIDLLLFMNFNNQVLTLCHYSSIVKLDTFCIVTGINYSNISAPVQTLAMSSEPLFTCHYRQTMQLYMDFLISSEYNVMFFESAQCCYLKFTKENKKPSLFKHDYIMHFGNSSNVVFSYIDRVRIWNLNNSFVAWAFSNEMNMENSEESYTGLIKYIEDFISTKNFYPAIGTHKRNVLAIINKMLTKLNTQYKTNFIADEQWFPHWAQDGLRD